MAWDTTSFGAFIRRRRELLSDGPEGRRYSVRQVAGRVGFQPAYLSKIERDLEAPPSEAKIVRLAGRDLPDEAVLRLVREFRDGDW